MTTSATQVGDDAATTTTTSPGQAQREGTFLSFTGANGTSLRYHYESTGEGLRSSDHRGLLVFFDGDGTSHFERPAEGRASLLGASAEQAGWGFAYLEAPVDRRWGAGEPDASAMAAQELISGLAGGQPVVMMGYSGGAEFVAQWLLADGSQWLPQGSRVIFVGGGGITGAVAEAPPSQQPSLTWVVGDEDGFGATAADDFSALESTERGLAAYQAAGYDTARRVIVDGNHTSYDFSQILASYSAEQP